MLFDENFASFEAESPRQTDGLAASVAEDFRSSHSYDLYLLAAIVKVWDHICIAGNSSLDLLGAASLAMEGVLHHFTN
jgi:hypothetical protein